MTSTAEALEPDRQARIAALRQTLHETERVLQALTGGVFLLPGARQYLGQQEANRDLELLDALPAHVAVLDADGVIVAVNAAWRRFGDENGLRDANHCLGRSYLDACGPPPGPGAAQTWAVAAGLRALLAGERSNFSVEYRCDSPSEQRFFLLMAAPLVPGRRAGAVVMHINVSARARSEQATLRSTELLQAVADARPMSSTSRTFTGATCCATRRWPTSPGVRSSRFLAVTI